MEDDVQVISAVYELFDNAKRMYGDSIENYWFYDSEHCPACGKKIDIFKFGKENAISLNGYMYRDMNVFIAYLLCGRCATEIFRKSNKSKIIYKNLEENLKNAYAQFMKSSAS